MPGDQPPVCPHRVNGQGHQDQTTADAGPNGYIDLVNSPQDHSCCSGYICAEQLSTFFTMVATGREYKVMFTSISPQKFRLDMLYTDCGDAVNNLDFSADDYNLLPPNPAEHVTALTEPNGTSSTRALAISM